MSIPKERWKLRPNIEATAREFKIRTEDGKLKVRGLIKASLFAYSSGIAINFGRTYRFLVKNGCPDGFNRPIIVFLKDIMSNTGEILTKCEFIVDNFSLFRYFFFFFIQKIFSGPKMSKQETLIQLSF